MVVRSLAIAALVATTACYTVRPVMNAREFITSNQPSRVWVVDNANETYVINTPRVEGDNIVGLRGNSGATVTVPLGSAQLVEAKQRDKGKTLAVGVILGVVGAGAIYMVANGGDQPGDGGTYTGDM